MWAGATRRVNLPGNGSSRKDVPACWLLWLPTLSSAAFDYVSFPELSVLCGFLRGVKGWEGMTKQHGLLFACPCLQRPVVAVGVIGDWSRIPLSPAVALRRRSLVSARCGATAGGERLVTCRDQARLFAQARGCSSFPWLMGTAEHRRIQRGTPKTSEKAVPCWEEVRPSGCSGSWRRRGWWRVPFPIHLHLSIAPGNVPVVPLLCPSAAP